MVTSQSCGILLLPTLLLHQPHLRAKHSHQEEERDAHVMLSQEMVSQADRRGQGLIAELTDIISSLTLVLLPKLLLDSFNVLFKCAFRSFHFLLWMEEQVVQLHQLSRWQDGDFFSSLCSKKNLGGQIV